MFRSEYKKSCIMSRGDFGSGWSASYGSVSTIEAGGGGPRTAGFNRTTHGGYQQEGQQGQDFFQEFGDSVSSNVFQINNNTTALERILRQISNGKDAVPEERIHQIQIATNTLASKTTVQLKQMSKLCGGSSTQSRQQRVQHERLKEEFRESVSHYYSIQNKVAEKEKFLVESLRASSRSGGRVASDNFNEKTSLVEEESRRQKQEKLEEQIVYDEDVIRDREMRIRQIEGDILDINEIFKDLATMVYEQGEMVDSIEGNIDRAYTNVESGNVQLQKASAYQKKARRKMCILLIVIAVVAAIVGVVIYISTSN